MNPFENKDIALKYDDFYKTNFGKKVDFLEKIAISKLLSNIKPTKILEIGCGTGHWTEFFCSLNFNVTAIDISKPMIEIAKTKNISCANFMVANASNLDFESNFFELVAAITVLEFTDNPIQVLNEMYRVAKINSKLIVGCLNAQSYLFQNKADNSIIQKSSLFSKKEIIDILSNFGKVFVVEQAVYVDENLNIFESSNCLVPAFIACCVKINK